MPFIIISAVVAILVAILAIQNSMMVDHKVEQLMKAQGGVMDPADTSTTPAAPVKPDAQKTPGGSFGN